MENIGHNSSLGFHAYDHLKTRLKELRDALERAPQTVSNEEESLKFTDLCKLFKTLSSEAEKARKVEKDPIIQAGKSVDAFFGAITEPALSASKDIEKRLNAWVVHKREVERRKALEEAEKARKEAEAAMKAAADLEAAGLSKLSKETFGEAEKVEKTAQRLESVAQDNKELGKVRSDIAQTTMRKKKVIAISDRSKIDWTILGRFIDDDTIIRAARQAESLGFKEIGGITISEIEELSVR